ncbi:MAG: hypothetical protein WA563_13345, partial [Candidatus Acidiferrales bacterium]
GQPEPAMTSANTSNPPILKLREAFQRHLSIPAEDLDVIDLVFAVLASHRIPGDPLWGMIIDASGGGKTEVLRSVRHLKDLVVFVSKLTAKSLKSGYRDPKHPKDDPSLLPLLNGKVLIIKDLGPILSMRRDDRNAVLSDLRDAYDGFTDDAYGNIGKVNYESRFSVLAASTLAIERFSSVEQELGERFIKFRARGNDNRSKIRRAANNTGKNESCREEIQRAVTEFMASLPPTVPMKMPDEMREAITVVADFAATARSQVARDRNHELVYAPRPEVGTRLVNELMKLALSLAFIRGKAEPDAEELATVCRIAEDCLPPNRLEVLAAAVACHSSRLPDKTARNTTDDLEILGIFNPDRTLKPEWTESLASVRKLLLTPALRKSATSGGSSIFIGNAESPYKTPPYTTDGLSEYSASIPTFPAPDAEAAP